MYLCRCSIEQSKGGGRSKRGHCAICSSNTLTAAKCVLVTMVVLKLPVQSRARSGSTITELSVFKQCQNGGLVQKEYKEVPVQSQCYVAKHNTLSRVDSVQVGKK